MSFVKALLMALVTLSVACGPVEQPAAVTIQEDIVKTAPDRARLLLENDHIVATLFTLPAQAELPMHRGGDRVVYSLSDYRLQFRTEDGEPALRDFRRGEVHWHPGEAHGIRNVGATRAEYLVVTRKTGNPAGGVTSNLAELDPEQARVIFENENAKVIDISLKPGKTQPMHKGAARLVYSLTAMKVKLVSGAGSSESAYSPGEVHYHPGGDHRVTNLSKEPVRYLVFELM
jgi:quercetin dioxygenase-like cupin family protein